MNTIELCVAAIVVLLVVSTWRGHRELRVWRGRDAFLRSRLLRGVAFLVAAALVGQALVYSSRKPPRLSGSGADVVLAIDVSRSMDARDTAPSRLRRALRTAERIALEAQGVRLGLVAFAGKAFVALPLTQDRDALLTYIRALDSETISLPGSDLGELFAAAARTFDPRSDRPRQLILLSDGEHSGGNLENTLTRLRSRGIRVIAVGFGKTDGALIPLGGGGWMEGDDGRSVRSVREDALLQRIASSTDGRYLRDWDDRPSAASLLPLPEERKRSEAPPERDPLGWLVGGALLALAAELWLSSRSRRHRVRGNGRRLALAAASAGLVAFGPATWLADGDAHLEQDKPDQALSLFRRAERSWGLSPATRIRVGNAQYRLGRLDQAAGAYLDALRMVERDDDVSRFAASFNLGNTLLGRERWREAHDAFWTAVVARPESLEAKFNYEWAAERIEPEPPLPDLPPRTSQESESESEDDAQSGEGGAAQQRRSTERRGSFSQAEAERWMQSLEEKVGDTLQRQINRELGGHPQGARQGQTW